MKTLNPREEIEAILKVTFRHHDDNCTPNSIDLAPFIDLLDRFGEELIEKPEKQDWDEYYGFCNRCDHQPTDETKNCICTFRNELRQQQRNLKAKLLGKGE